jgi:hypothetical protein
MKAEERRAFASYASNARQETDSTNELCELVDEAIEFSQMYGQLKGDTEVKHDPNEDKLPAE